MTVVTVISIPPPLSKIPSQPSPTVTLFPYRLSKTVFFFHHGYGCSYNKCHVPHTTSLKEHSVFVLGAADGAFLLQKEKRTGNAATLEVSGRDQQDQKLYLIRNTETLLWELQRAETELWKEPPEPLLDEIAELVMKDISSWEGSATDTDVPVNDGNHPQGQDTVPFLFGWYNSKAVFLC